MKNPFKKDTTSHHDWEVLKDLNWHCTKCELKSGQAKTWQVWRQEKGIQIDKDENDNWFKRLDCPKCDNKTIHRKLKSLELLDETKSRSGINQKLARRVKQVYENTDALFLRKISPNLLEVDHKFPQIRWKNNEKVNQTSMSDDEIKEKFILLTRENNLLKSRKCENCVKTGIRGNFPGIYFWYQGDENWQGDKHHENGCVGCFWHNPYKWREELNNIVNK
jgi:hypothetical protein